MHPSLLSLVLALGVFDPSPHVDVTSVVHFKPVHDGFLLVRHPNTGEVFYSHGGTFHLDGQGRLLDDADMALLTVKLNAAAGNASWEDLRLPLADLDTPHASAMMAWRGNLDPFAAVLRFDPAHPAVTSNFAAHATVYDALGGHHDVAVYFNAGGTEKERIVYRWVAMTDPNALYDPNMPMAPTPDIGDASQDPAAPTTAAAAADPNVSDANGLKRDVFGQVGQGRIQFHRNGTLAEVLNANFTVHFANLPEPQTVKLDFGKPVDLRHNGRSGLTAFTGQEVQAHVTQDGYRHRWVTAVSELDINGTLMAVLSDGAMVPLDPVVMARFYNMHGMALIQNDLFAANDQSGPPNLTLATCADMVTTVIFKDATDGSVARVEPALGDCPLMPQPWQKVAAAPGTYFALEGEHAGHLGVYLAKEVDLRLIAGEPLQESRERLKLQAVAPIAGDTDSAIAAGGLVVPQATDLLSPKMTTAIVLTGNLDASNPPRTMDPYHLQNSANTSMAVAVYDHTGAPHQLRFDFYAHAKAETDAVPHHRYLWIATFDPPSVESSDGSSELDASIADGLLQFNPNGTLRAPTTTTLDLPIGPGGTMVQQTLFFWRAAGGGRPKCGRGESCGHKKARR